MVPVTVDDFAANGLLGDAHPQQCWERSVETLTARKDEITGLAVASDERIDACILCRQREGQAEIVALRTYVADGGVGLRHLLARLCSGDVRTFRLPKVHPAEISNELLGTLGFQRADGHRLYAATARAD